MPRKDDQILVDRSLQLLVPKEKTDALCTWNHMGAWPREISETNHHDMKLTRPDPIAMPVCRLFVVFISAVGLLLCVKLLARTARHSAMTHPFLAGCPDLPQPSDRLTAALHLAIRCNAPLH